MCKFTTSVVKIDDSGFQVWEPNLTANTESVVSRENSEDDYILINEKNINEVLTLNNELCHKLSSNKNRTENSAEEE